MAQFLAMATAHFIGFKVPMLFIYYDVPSEAYQGKIIAFCAFAYAMFAIAAMRSLAAVVPFILAMIGVVVGLSLVNRSDHLAEVVEGASTGPIGCKPASLPWWWCCCPRCIETQNRPILLGFSL